ncbi:MAG: DUF3604 domain-containing protein [Actinomycetales bacterium]
MTHYPFGSAPPDRLPPRRTSEVLSPEVVGAEVTLLHGDLHNHSLHSDGRGDPETAFAVMRDAGLDFAALTDHATIPHDVVPHLSLADYPDEAAVALARMVPRTIGDKEWLRTLELADLADTPGEFTAIAGFEWSEQWLGHVNIWGASSWTPVRTPGRIESLHQWLRDVEQEALFGYNHPGREPGRHGDFGTLPDEPLHGAGLSRRMVGLEVFNRTDDYLLWGVERGLPSPIVEVLDKGWRPGLVGCSDEHGREYGVVGRGRTGLWVREHSREGVREALLARRTFATREPGLVLAAAFHGVPMGGEVSVRQGSLAVDLAGAGLDGRDVVLQVLVSDGAGLPRVATQATVVAGSPLAIDVELPDEAGWCLLRVADPWEPEPGVDDVSNGAVHGRALGYTAPWWVVGESGE